jgi:hypothetical protein
MNNKRFALVTLFALLTSLSSAAVSAQRIGGYREIDKADEGAATAADFAVKAQSEKKEMTYKLVSIEHAETQTVAGINYRLCLKIGHHKQDDDVDTTEFANRQMVILNQGIVQTGGVSHVGNQAVGPGATATRTTTTVPAQGSQETANAG